MEWQQSSSSFGMGFFCADGKGDFVFFSNFYWIFFYAKFMGVLSRISIVSCSDYPQKGYSFWYYDPFVG